MANNPELFYWFINLTLIVLCAGIGFAFRQLKSQVDVSDLLLQVEDLRTQFRTEEGLVKAVDGVDLDLLQDLKARDAQVRQLVFAVALRLHHAEELGERLRQYLLEREQPQVAGVASSEFGLDWEVWGDTFPDAHGPRAGELGGEFYDWWQMPELEKALLDGPGDE